MSFSTIQQHVFRKHQSQATYRQSDTTVKSGLVYSFTCTLNRVRGFVSDKKSAFKKARTGSTPSLASSTSSFSSSSYRVCSEGSHDDHFNVSCHRLSSKSDTLESLIFDHPTVTLRISPMAYHSF
ncbi:hypothetical protein BDF14DRAFT_1880012 [Spinellus fusiger]|nr:hypothetical protein BDF14DRAFT_1880012 [Spinellus fusiger]